MYAFLPIFIGEYKSYVDFRSSEYQKQLAIKSLQIALAISALGSYVWLWFLESLLPFAWPLLLGTKGASLEPVIAITYWNFIWLWVFFNASLNIYCGKRFQKPDWRAWNIKRSPQRRAMVARQLVRKLTTRKQLSTIGRRMEGRFFSVRCPY
jgi:hypothetical protein